MPVQVCPRGCEYRELARRDLLARTRFLGRAALHVSYTFETTNCPECGARLARECARCKNGIFAPVADRCQFCGLPQPWASERRAGAERASIRLWRKEPDDVPESERRVHDPALPLYRSHTNGDVWVIDGDIAHLAVDAVVSNDDVDGQMWAQVARAIKNAAGEGVERLAQEGKPFKLGNAWLTTPGALGQMKHIIHVASMSRHGESTIKTVRECLVAALAVADEKHFESVGIAAIGSGPAAINPAEWFRVFAETTIAHLDVDSRDQPRMPRLAIVLVLFEPPDFEAELRTLQRAFFDAWEKTGKPAGGEPDWRPDSNWKRLLDRVTTL
jgi:O-acetyl-ADP-ribose deacetylase (regulator of RNase III)